jgi:MFS transporter, ACS family, solute carrier family 17 (sodium-dependent inorganic phosphate cotransporter), other
LGKAECHVYFLFKVDLTLSLLSDFSKVLITHHKLKFKKQNVFHAGLGEGTTFPALSALLATWVPLKERSKLGSFVFGGGQIGTILGTALSGLLLDYFDGWESVFYFFGFLGVLWFFVFILICYKDPESHPFIKESEKDYLRREMGSLERDRSLPPTPWRAVFTSVPMMAL